ncbi:MAG TPA: TlpA disulfide reductase family protein [Candidatus Xenobia bacterium]|nr:TlpA disulfide reductase family protein [Candidatus Xenobia bacterium]
MKDKVTPVVLGLVLLALLLGMRQPGSRVEAPEAGEEAPNFSFVLNGQPRELRDLRGQVVLLNFWATWCPPCVTEIPSLERLHRRLGPQGLIILAVSVDEDPVVYENFLRSNNITFATVRDPEKRISRQYGTFMYPETYVIDRQGRLVRKIIGALEWDEPDTLDFLTRVLEAK